jgi:hypothetical protein
MDGCIGDPSMRPLSALTYSDYGAVSVCYTQMRRKNAKMGMEGADETVREVVGEQREPHRRIARGYGSCRSRI